MADVVGAERDPVVGELGFGGVGEAGLGADRAEVAEGLVPGEGAEGDDHPEVEQGELGGQPGGAVVALGGERPVVGRGALDRGGDVAAAEGEAVVGRHRGRLVGEAGTVQAGEQPVAGAVAGEDPAGAVAAVGGRGQPEDQQRGRRVAESGDGPAPVLLVAEGGPLLPGHLLPPGDQPGAALLRARLAAAGLEPPDDTTQLERDLALHLERVDALTAAADLHPSDPPLPDPTRWAGPGGRALGRGAVDSRRPVAPGRVTLPEGAPIAAGRVGARPAGAGAVGAGPDGAGADGGLREQARLVREGEATSVELVGRALERIERLDPEVGAFVLVLGDQALAEAAERDAERRRGRVAGVLHGVPVAVKDLVDMEGVVTGAGSVKLAGNRAAGDAEVVARLRRAGAV